jgi:hypothetical protein
VQDDEPHPTATGHRDGCDASASPCDQRIRDRDSHEIECNKSFFHNYQERCNMNGQQRNTYRCFRRVQEFLASQQFADSPAALGKQLEELTGVVTQLSQETLDQEAGAR